MDLIALFEKLIGYEFKSEEYLVQAITSRAYTNENDRREPYKDVLALIGDAIAKIVIYEYASKLGLKHTGAVTDLRKAYENQKYMAYRMREIIKTCQFQYLFDNSDIFRISEGERKQEDYKGDRFLEQTFEALIGAIYFDSGFEEAKKVTFSTLFSDKDFETFVEHSLKLKASYQS